LQNIHQTVLGPEMFSTFEDDIKKFPDQINEEVLSFLTWGAGINTSAYKQALKRKQTAVTSFYHLFKQVDLILTPTISILPTPIHQREINIDGNQQRIDHILSRLTCLANITGFPALSVPGIPKEGLPVGLQLIG